MCLCDSIKRWFKKPTCEIIHVTHNSTKHNLNMFFDNPLYEGPNKKSKYGNYYEDVKTPIKKYETWKDQEYYDDVDIFDVNV